MVLIAIVKLQLDKCNKNLRWSSLQLSSLSLAIATRTNDDIYLCRLHLQACTQGRLKITYNAPPSLHTGKIDANLHCTYNVCTHERFMLTYIAPRKEESCSPALFPMGDLTRGSTNESLNLDIPHVALSCVVEASLPCLCSNAPASLLAQPRITLHSDLAYLNPSRLLKCARHYNVLPPLSRGPTITTTREACNTHVASMFTTTESCCSTYGGQYNHRVVLQHVWRTNMQNCTMATWRCSAP